MSQGLLLDLYTRNGRRRCVEVEIQRLRGMEERLGARRWTPAVCVAFAFVVEYIAQVPAVFYAAFAVEYLAPALAVHAVRVGCDQPTMKMESCSFPWLQVVKTTVLTVLNIKVQLQPCNGPVV